MNPLLAQSRPKRQKRGMHFMLPFYPPDPITFGVMERVTIDAIKASFSGIEDTSLDCSVTLPCSLFFGRPQLSKKDSKKDNSSKKIFSHTIDIRLSSAQMPLLGLQHGWDLCRRQKEIPFLRLSGINRIWFYSICLYEPVVAISATETQPTFETGGGELRFVMTRKSENSPWKMSLAPSCDYFPNTDCIALAQL